MKLKHLLTFVVLLLTGCTLVRAYPPAPAPFSAIAAANEPYLYVTPAWLTAWAASNNISGGSSTATTLLVSGTTNGLDGYYTRTTSIQGLGPGFAYYGPVFTNAGAGGSVLLLSDAAGNPVQWEINKSGGAFDYFISPAISNSIPPVSGWYNAYVTGGGGQTDPFPALSVTVAGTGATAAQAAIINNAVTNTQPTVNFGTATVTTALYAGSKGIVDSSGQVHWSDTTSATFIGTDGNLHATNGAIVFKSQGTTFYGSGAGLTNLQPTNIVSGVAGVGYIYNSNLEVVRTNNARDITILQKPSGAILYSNGVNAGVVSGASSVQVVVGFPNNPFWFGTNANWVLNGLVNYTNGWSTSFALNTTNKNGSAITITHMGFTSVTSNGVDCASGVITIPAGHKAYGGGDVGPIDATSSATNIFWLIK